MTKLGNMKCGAQVEGTSFRWQLSISNVINIEQSTISNQNTIKASVRNWRVDGSKGINYIFSLSKILINCHGIGFSHSKLDEVVLVAPEEVTASAIIVVEKGKEISEEEGIEKGWEAISPEKIQKNNKIEGNLD
ncbi:hypothetical protein H5410_037807 [Solanum commersonii]|uniref:Uncharacterized protein n=1 Tax=Solanum commersonii TaxID=4109 RepID=A0A9J5Y9I3_SOLCO|nr:hypothetical protein H5410_037807 [Solanum commersonii]